MRNPRPGLAQFLNAITVGEVYRFFEGGQNGKSRAKRSRRWVRRRSISACTRWKGRSSPRSSNPRGSTLINFGKPCPVSDLFGHHHGAAWIAGGIIMLLGALAWCFLIGEIAELL